MSDLHISLPDELREFVDAQVSQGGYSTPDEYLGALLREARKNEEQERLEARLLKGLDSGPGIEATPEYWREKEARLVSQHQQAEGG
jgi:antitoxin ParD1/3/4